MKNNRNPSVPRKADSIIKRLSLKFLGMITGEPANKLPETAALLNYNVIDYTQYFKVRPGSRLYSSLTIGWAVEADTDTDEVVVTDLDGDTLASNPFKTGDAVYFDGDDLPVDIATGVALAKETAYYISVVLTSTVYHYKLYEDRSDALNYESNNITFSSTGNFLIARILFGAINGFCDHVKSGYLVWLIGQSVFITDKEMSEFIHVLNLNNENPDGISTIIPLDGYALLYSKQGGLFKIILDEDFFYMFKMNHSAPDTRVDDIAESLVYDGGEEIVATSSLQYGFLYIYAVSRIVGGGANNTRMSEDSLLQMETGTNIVPGSERDYGECYFKDNPGVAPYDSGDPQTVSGLYRIKGEDARGATHFSLYRTKDIGTKGTLVSINRRDQYVWLDDVPVCKAVSGEFSVDVVSPYDVYMFGGDVGEYDSEYNLVGSKFKSSDIGSKLRISVGDAVAEYTIESISDEITGLPAVRLSATIDLADVTSATAGDNTDIVVGTGEAENFTVGKYYLMYGAIKSENFKVTAIDTDTDTITADHLDENYTSGDTIKRVSVNGYVTTACIGGFRISSAAQHVVSGRNVLQITSGDSFIFTPNDNGRIIFLSDGTIRHINEVPEDGNIAYVKESGDFGGFLSDGDVDPDDSGMLAAAMQYDSDSTDWVYERNYCDVIPDSPQADGVSSLLDRIFSGGTLMIPRRLYYPFPNGEIALSQDGFLVVAERGGSRYYYTDTGAKPYCLGFYKNPDQSRAVVGSIQHIIGMPFRAILFLKNKTGVLTLNSSQNFGNTEVGDNVFVVPELSIVDDLKGVVLWKFITQKNSSIVYAITSDGSFRYFDGYQWSKEDMTFVGGVDSVSKEYIKRIDQSKPYSAIYSNNGGIKLWFYKNIDGVSTPVCLRLATDDSEGRGWSEIGGDDWVTPHMALGVFAILDDNYVQRIIVIDDDSNTEFKIFEIDSFNRGSFEKPYALDKIGDKPALTLIGEEVAWYKRTREETVDPSSENYRIRIEDAHVFVQPDDRGNRGKTGYTSTGQRDAQELTYKSYVDGEQVTPSGAIRDFPENGELVFSGRKVEGHRIMHELSGTAGEIIVTGIVNNYLAKVATGSEELRTMTEHTLQKELSTGKVLHICRDYLGIVNRVGNVSFRGGTITMISGADDREFSGAQLTEDIAVDNSEIAGSYTIIGWGKGAPPVLSGGVTQYGSSLTNGWSMYYETGTGLAAALKLRSGASGIFDIRIYNKVISADALSEYYDDVANHSGEMFLPGFKS